MGTETSALHAFNNDTGITSIGEVLFGAAVINFSTSAGEIGVKLDMTEIGSLAQATSTGVECVSLSLVLIVCITF